MKLYYDSEADIPADQKTAYTSQKHGDLTLWVRNDVEGAIPRVVHDQFRATNTTLLQERDTLKGELKTYREAGVDVAEYARLQAVKKQLDNKELIKLEKLEENVSERTATMRTEHENEVKKLRADIAARDSELAQVKIADEITKEVTQYGVEPWALEDVIRAGREKFVLEDGKVVAYKDDGSGGRTKDYGSSQGGILTISEWAKDLPGKKPGYFKKNAGLETDPTKRSGDLLGGRPNPWKPDATGKVNMTLQGEITRKDPVLAQRLRAEAGVQESAYAKANKK